MTNEEAFGLIGERAEELAKRPEVQKKMLEIGDRDGDDAAVRCVCLMAIATLFGTK